MKPVFLTPFFLMWNRNFLFRAHEAVPLPETENDVFHETDPALDSSGLTMDKYISVWLQGEGEDDHPLAYTNVYVRTATLDPVKKVGFLQPLQGRSHQIRQMLSPEQKTFLKDWLKDANPTAWEEAEEYFQKIFE